MRLLPVAGQPALFLDRDGVPIDQICSLTYHTTTEMSACRKGERTRKPGPGMILREKFQIGLSLEDSVLVGGKPIDMLAGIEAILRTNALSSKNAFPELVRLDYRSVRALEEVILCLKRAVAMLALR